MNRAAFIVWLIGIALLQFVPSAPGQLASRGESAARSNWGIGFGARSMAMGGAFIAIADDITAMNHNPAGLSQLLKPEISLGYSYGGQSLRVPESVFEWPDPAFHITYTTNPYTVKFGSLSLDFAGGIVPFKVAKIPIVLGFAYQNKFSDAADYTYEYDVDIIASTGESTKQHLTDALTLKGGTHVFVFSLSARPLEFLHVGFNVNSWRNKSEFHSDQMYIRDYYFNGIWQSTTEDIIPTDWYYDVRGGVSFDAGILLKLKSLSAGFVYKSGFEGDFIYNHGEYSGIIYWPGSYGVGLAFRPFELLTLTGDYTRTNWSTWRFELPSGETIDYSPTDRYQFRLGAEYLALFKNVSLPIRAGWFYDRSNSIGVGGPLGYSGLTFGTGLASSFYTIDLAAVYQFAKTQWTNSTSLARIVGWGFHTSIAFRFGRD